MSRKRSREDDEEEEVTVTSRQKEWEEAVAWIQSEGGTIHSSLRFSNDREMFVATKQIEDNEEVFRIPKCCLISWSSVQQDKDGFGEQLIKVLKSMDSSKFYSQLQDLAIALYLANSDSTKQATSASNFQPYLDILPEASTYDTLPRRWTPEQLKILEGSSLLPIIHKQKDGILKDYDHIKKEWVQKYGDSNHHFPLFQAFSDRLAAVSSRAFAGFGGSSGSDEEDIALVPLLDLADHCRGRQTTKNVSYTKSEDGTIIVNSISVIEKGDLIKITYGAQSNAQLLLNYGFAISDNLEPDGSSNDFLDFYPFPDQHTTVRLRAGPKAHSFHGFVNALDAFRSHDLETAADPGKSQAEKEEDFEANEEQFAEWGDLDMTMNMDEIRSDDDDDGETANDLKMQKEEAIESYRKALNRFRTRLEAVIKGYYLKSDELDKLIAEGATSKSTAKKHFAALLVKSELRTIYFAVKAVDRIHELLLGASKSASSIPPQTAVNLSKSDVKLVEEQVAALSAAFLKLRIPELDMPRAAVNQ